MQKKDDATDVDTLTEEQPFIEQESDTKKKVLYRIVNIVWYVADLSLLFGFGYLWQLLFMLPYCGLLYQCGCTYSWKGGADHCNAFDPNAQYR